MRAGYDTDGEAYIGVYSLIRYVQTWGQPRRVGEL